MYYNKTYTKEWLSFQPVGGSCRDSSQLYGVTFNFPNTVTSDSPLSVITICEDSIKKYIPYVSKGDTYRARLQKQPYTGESIQAMRFEMVGHAILHELSHASNVVGDGFLCM